MRRWRCPRPTPHYTRSRIIGTCRVRFDRGVERGLACRAGTTAHLYLSTPSPTPLS